MPSILGTSGNNYTKAGVDGADGLGQARTLTVVHTVPANTGTLLVMQAHYDVFNTCDSVTWNGGPQGLTRIGTESNEMSAWQVRSPTPGTSSICIVMNGSRWQSAGAVNLASNSVAGLVFSSTNCGEGACPSGAVDSVTTSPSELCVDMIFRPFCGNQTYTEGAGQTSLYEQSSGEANIAPWSAMSWKQSSSGTATVLSWVLGVSGGINWSHGIVSRIPADIAPEEEEDNIAPGTGINPPPGDLPSSFPLLWLELKVGGTVTAYAETALNDNATWTKTIGTPTRKPAKILRVSQIRRELTREGNFGTSSWRIEVADHDRAFRTAAANSTISNSYCALYFVDDAVRRAEGEPFRIAAGVVVSHRALPGFRYELEVEDVLGAYFGDAFRQPQIPPHILTIGEFQGLDPAAEGKPGPLAFGVLSDATASSPQGVIPAIYMGYGLMGSLTGHSLAVNTLVDAWLFCEHAVSSIADVFYNHPSSPTLRHAVPDGSFGTDCWAPHKPNWNVTYDYVDYPSGGVVRRYTPLFINRAHSLADAAREGRTIISANLAGAESTGDANGTFFSDPVRLLAHTLINYVFDQYDTGIYASIPFFPANSYTVMDTTTVNAAASVGATRLGGGYIGAVYIGGDGQTNGYDIMRECCVGGDFDLGTNRHGQQMFSREDVSATPVVSYTAQRDILEGEFSMWIDRGGYANKLTYKYAPRYLPPSAPLPTPAAGAPLPSDPFAPSANWASSIRVITDTTAITNYSSKTVPYAFENTVVRDHDTAQSVASFVIARMTGPSDDGAWMFQFTTGLQGYGKNATYVDLGSVIQFEIPERLGTVATSPVIGRVTAFEVDPQAKRTTLEGRVLR